MSLPNLNVGKRGSRTDASRRLAIRPAGFLRFALAVHRGLRFNRDRNPSVADGQDNRMGPIRRRELVSDRAQVVSNGPFADPENLANLSIRPTTRDVR